MNTSLGAGELGPVSSFRTCDLWMCQKITRDRDIVVQRCCATRTGWITHDTDVCYLPAIENPLHHPNQLPGRFTGPGAC